GGLADCLRSPTLLSAKRTDEADSIRNGNEIVEKLLIDYALFAVKLATVIVAIIVLFGALAFVFSRAKKGAESGLKVKDLNQKYEDMGLALNAAILPGKAFKQLLKQNKYQHELREREGQRKNVYVLTFKGDLRASEVASLRESITAILMVATPLDEVVVLLESLGGTVHDYGLAASQLSRIRDKGIRLTVAVDKLATSGGYMMASVADHIIAAPFAIIGSIGVVAQLPNFNRLLKSHDIDFEQITAGEFKRTLTLFGENTEKGREKVREDIEEAHNMFKAFIAQHRGQVDIDRVATGEHWFGARALELKLVDELRTSDDYLHEASTSAHLYEVSYAYKKSWLEKLFPFL
ncbi:MAG: protease SohB, partial [Pseudomonadota bacterium]